MDKKEIAKEIGKDLTTLYNWEKKNPKLYEAVYKYFNQNEENEEIKKLLDLFKKLEEKEKKFYLLDMERRIIKKEIEKG